MSDRDFIHLIDQRLIEQKKVTDNYQKDYQRVHELLDSMLEKNAKPLAELQLVEYSNKLIRWIAANYAHASNGEMLSDILRVGLCHLCSAAIVAPPQLSAEEFAVRACTEAQRRGWDLAYYDAKVVEQAIRDLEEAAKLRALNHHRKDAQGVPAQGKAASAHSGNVNIHSTHKDATADEKKKTAIAKKEAMMATTKASAAVKKPATKSTAAKATKKPAAKAASASKAAVKKPAAKATAAKKPAATKKVVAAKKPAVKKVTAAKKPAAAKKPVAKKAAAVKKPAAAKKPAAKKPAVKAVAAKKPAVAKTAAKAPAKKPVAPKMDSGFDPSKFGVLKPEDRN